MAKAKRSTLPRRRETRAARKRRREEAGEGDGGDDDLRALSGEEFEEELAGDPTESEFEGTDARTTALFGPTSALDDRTAATSGRTAEAAMAGRTAEAAGTRQAQVVKKCAGDKVRELPLLFAIGKNY